MVKDQEAAARGRTGGIWGGGAGFNREMKRRRIEVSKNKATPIVQRLRHNPEALLLMASALYMGEGEKGDDHFGFANSDPQIIGAWMAILRTNFEIDESKFRCRVLLSDDQDVEMLQEFWSKITAVSRFQFQKPGIKKASGQRKPGYMGVCMVYYYSEEIRRFLDAIGRGVIDELLSNKVK